jgi:hypothetical protein
MTLTLKKLTKNRLGHDGELDRELQESSTARAVERRLAPGPRIGGLDLRHHRHDLAVCDIAILHRLFRPDSLRDQKRWRRRLRTAHEGHRDHSKASSSQES